MVKQLYGMAVRHVVTGLGVWLVAKGAMSPSDEGPFTDIVAGLCVFAFTFAWGWFAKEMQRNHWFDALYTPPPSPAPSLVVRAPPPAPGVDPVVDAARTAAMSEAIRSVTMPPGAGL
jgi:hypothetical protein